MVNAYPESFAKADIAAAIAATRFGYGPRPGELAFIAEDPGGWLIAQLRDDPEPEAIHDLPRTPVILREMRAAEAAGGATVTRYRQEVQARGRVEAARHVLAAITGPNPFRERLVRFWAEFFGIGLDDPATAPFAFAFEREVIRPNLTRRYYDMMLAAVRHPALILKYRNHLSFARRSAIGRDRRENLETGLARAILEDFTIGPVGGTTGLWRETDVRALANMLTGWGLRDVPDRPETAPAVRRAPLLPAPFAFDPRAHADGPKFMLDRDYQAAGVLEGEAALDTLTRMPAVGRRLARLLVRAVVTDDPPEPLVEAVADGYAAGGGSLGGLAATLATSNAAFEPALRKVKRPDDLVISVYRALGLRPTDGGAAIRDIAMLGMGPAAYGAPLAVPDTADHWLAPTRFADRLDWCAGTAIRALQSDPRGPEAALDLGFDALGPKLSPHSYRRLAVALDIREAAALLFASPEFQTR
ncbi:DUF1800 family protein [Marivibrio halodurans]|uniref:DUF1800 family protein n=1 Tax=Marivibrio halodurans TaxID=2039722 RepID=A0A8J7V3H2_9PROT|nr:DUF1800 family protein [Marivibrio halodurans]MBP5856834.1 DUF1800 family protein [Marivibrio halodurans]